MKKGLSASSSATAPGAEYASRFPTGRAAAMAHLSAGRKVLNGSGQTVV
ncbi:TPA: hypothetical protein NN192_002608 [Escherichia coli]|nr:hypothetical protein [Escherichia coli]EEZ6116669.1 hypothetical protein [Escherichia coli O73]EFF9504265.1 hypothetical protein [Escherichia coli]EFH3552809.1 hypothetical protein [Escherichia coli]EFH8623360.1 hypothetical protein [Escherichia coli]EFH9669484.1 hypothetical protein [Escherichia coli]